MTDLRRHLHDLEQVSGGLAEGFQAFVGKLAGVAGTFALILHVVADPAKCHEEIGVRTVEDVSRLMTGFIVPHAMEFYRTAESSGSHGDRLRKLASWILTSGQTRFVISDLTSNVADFRGLTPFEVAERVSPLEAGGWLKPNIRGGLARSWTVDPNRFHPLCRPREDRGSAQVGTGKSDESATPVENGLTLILQDFFERILIILIRVRESEVNLLF